MRSPPVAVLPLLALAMPTLAAEVQAVWLAPAADRWMYPFNATPGTRTSLSVFGSDRENPSLFDARDGQVLLAFDTGDQVPAGDAALSFRVMEAELTLEVQTDLVFRHDSTRDPWTDFLPSADPRRTIDADPGQPVEVAGVGFRSGWSATTFVETSPYSSVPGSVLTPSIRNAFAAQVDAQGVPTDISNHPRQGFQPAVFGVGKVDGLAEGALVPAGSVMRFRLDVEDAGVQAYLRAGLRRGRLWLSVSSLTQVQQQAGDFPVFYARENALVQAGLAQAAGLSLRVDTSPCDEADLDCSGSVDAGDIGGLLLRFGPCPGGLPGCQGDLDASGEVDAGDIGALLVRFD